MQALAFWKAVAMDQSNFLESLIALLAEHKIRYCVIGGQGVNAYAEPLVVGFDENAPLAILDDPTTEVINAETYGGLKALCERASLDWFGGVAAGAVSSEGAAPQRPGAPVSIVRPTYVVGPYDHTRRFTWWV